MGSVYIITNTTNNKVYVGSTIKPVKRRWDLHRSMLIRKCHHNIHLQRAWDKYGQGAFEFSMLEELDDPAELLKHEQTWLDLHRANGGVYNIALQVTNTTLGTKRTKEQREHLSRIRTGIPCPSRGHVWTDEERQRCSERNRGENNPNYGKTHSKEARQKISIAHKGKKKSKRFCDACAKPYPAFIHRNTGEIIPPGTNLTALCKKLNLDQGAMNRVKLDQTGSHLGWTKLVRDGS